MQIRWATDGDTYTLSNNAGTHSYASRSLIVYDHPPEEATVYFRSADTVELRYYDAFFSMRTLQSYASKPKTNPTKILGVVKRD